MKNLLYAVFIITLFSCNNNQNKADYVLVDGTVKNAEAKTLTFTGYDFNKDVSIVENGTFKDTLRIEKDGYYSIKVGTESSIIYLENGGTLSVTIDASQFDESLQYEGTLAPENNYLASKYLYNELNFDSKKVFSQNETDFLNTNATMQKAYDSILKLNKVENKNFIAFEAGERNYTKASNFENFQNYHRYYSKDESFKVTPTYYENVSQINFADTAAYRNSTSYQQLVASHFERLAGSDLEKNDTLDGTLAYLKKVDENFPAGYAKQNLMRDRIMYGMTPNNSLSEVYNIYKNTNPAAEDLEPITKRYAILQTLQKGNSSPTFTYENYEGGTKSIADFKGKYTYIDVWATWCGPCLGEIPSLKKVEEDYKGKDVQFVSISIDNKKDYEKWRNMIAEKKLGGTQLMADNNWQSQFVKDYAINGIPRFILLDRNGNIISADAPRPSDRKLRAMLDIGLALD